MAERKSLADSSESIDVILRKLEKAMGSEMATKLTPDLNAAKSALFAEVLEQASFDRLHEFANAPPARGESGSPPRTDAVGHDVETRKGLRSQGENDLTPENEAIVYEFRRPKEKAAAGGRPVEFPRDYKVMAVVSGKDAGGETGLYDAMQVAESSGGYLVMRGDVISAPSGTDYRITEDGIRFTGGKIQFTDARTTWEVMPARGPDGEARESRPDPATDAEIAKAVKQDARTWKAIRSQGSEKEGISRGRENSTREANER